MQKLDFEVVDEARLSSTKTNTPTSLPDGPLTEEFGQKTLYPSMLKVFAKS